jgi:hypothetical protein
MFKRPFQDQGYHSLGQVPLNEFQFCDQEDARLTRVLGVEVRQPMLLVVDRDDYPEEPADFWHGYNSIRWLRSYVTSALYLDLRVLDHFEVVKRSTQGRLSSGSGEAHKRLRPRACALDQLPAPYL